MNIIDPKNYGIDFYGDLIFTTEEEIAHHPQRVTAFKKATLKGWEYALENVDETIDMILDKYNTRSLNKEQLQYEARATKKLISAKYIKLGTVQKERFSILAKLYRDKGFLDKNLDKAVDEIIYTKKSNTEIFYKYMYPALITLIVLLLLVLALFYYNSRLRYLVAQRTKELEISTQKAKNAAASKSSFLANMSHEIRTPMNAILGFVEQLSKQETDVEKQKMFRIIENSGNNLLTIINDILDISKFESGNVALENKPCDLFKLLENIELLFETKCQENGVTFSLEVNSNVPQCSVVDETRLNQIIINLLGNAFKFTSTGGEILLKIRLLEQTQELEISVVDSGIGIAEENLDKIFNVFEQEDNSTTRRFGGTGLGLTISKKLADLMGGTISVISKVKVGSTFFLTLPYIKCELDVSKTVDVSKSKSNEQALHGKVLIVEDNKTNQMLLSMILEDLGLEYEVANNGQESVDIFNKDYSFNVILMDENMPVMNGIEAVKCIRDIESTQGRKHIPIIAVTANALSEDRERFLSAGMDDYVAKPYSEETIEKTLLKYL